jgi:cell wall-associated NlpC family hydrolase
MEFTVMKKVLMFFSISVLILFASCVTTEAGTIPVNSHVTGQSVSFSNTSGPVPVTRLLLTREAATYMRTPYASPPNAPQTFDCAAFISHIYAKFGYSLPRTSSSFGNVGTKIDWKDALPGDILVFSREKGSTVIDHVAILWEKSSNGDLAGSWIIHAASINTGTSLQRGNPETRTGIVITQLGLRGDGVIENEYFYRRFMYCTRVLKD